MELKKNQHISFIDLGDESTLLNESTELIDFLDEVKFNDEKYFPENKDEIIFNDENCDDESSSDYSDDSEPKKSCDKNKTLIGLGKVRYKLKNRPKTGLFDESFPKLKKRDLIEPKAYQGLCHLCGKHFQHLWVHLQSHSLFPTGKLILI